MKKILLLLLLFLSKSVSALTIYNTESEAHITSGVSVIPYADGYIPITTVGCSSNCSQCSYENNGFCVLCKTGYGNTRGGTCMKKNDDDCFSSQQYCEGYGNYDPNVASCLQRSDGCWIVSSCKPGYYLDWVDGTGAYCVVDPETSTFLVTRLHFDGSSAGSFHVNRAQIEPYLTAPESGLYTVTVDGQNVTQTCTQRDAYWDQYECAAAKEPDRYCEGYQSCGWKTYLCAFELPGCDECSSKTKCTRCLQGYTLKSDGTCASNKNSVNGNCPAGLSKSSDGNCCMK